MQRGAGHRWHYSLRRAVYKALEKGIPSVQRDTFHASRGLGRYALALLWYRMLTGRSVMENSFRDFDEPISDEQIQIIKETVESFAPLN